MRRKRIPIEDALAYLNIIDEMAIDVDPADSFAILHLLQLARAHELTCYDAAFLELAMRLQLPLATSDHALIRAAADAGVPLLRLPAWCFQALRRPIEKSARLSPRTPALRTRSYSRPRSSPR